MRMLLFTFNLILTLTFVVVSPVAAAKDIKTLSIEEVEALVAIGPEEGSYQLIDARPAVKFNKGHIPTAINIPKAVMIQNIDKLDRDKQLIFYCGGLACKLSGQSAQIAIEKGFTNVSTFPEGMPAWIDRGHYSIIELEQVEKLVMGNSKDPFLLIDARPAVKYQKGFIPGALSLPKAEFPLKKGLLPNDRSIPLVFYCGGYACQLSHKSAQLALDEGYERVSVFAAGEPAWREAGLPSWGNEAGGIVAKKKIEGLPETIGIEEFQKLMVAESIQIIDVRETEEFAKGHIPGSINIFDEDFIYKADEAVAKLDTDRRVVLVCTTGARSGSSYYALLDSNYANKAQLQYLDAKVTFNADGTTLIEKN
ncbi:MAG: sulfurtransferase [Desulfuromonas sp.]|nr:MAG: sulfurtransferase [Desulfuromonas sp.]